MSRKLWVILIHGCCLIQPVFGQRQNQPAVEGKGELGVFEEKQQQTLINPSKNMPGSGISGFNFRYAARKATPGVVHVKTVFSIRAGRQLPDVFKNFFYNEPGFLFLKSDDNKSQSQVANASGVIVSNDGYIVTNNHVVYQADSIEVVLNDERSYQAKLIGLDPATDLALIKIDEKDLPFVEFGNSDSLEVGDFVLAVGNPFNLASTVTAGIVSAKARSINILTDRTAIESYIQTDAAVNRGNSGGALVDINGRLVGINAAIATPTGSFAGYSFAIPVEIVKKAINDLLLYGKVVRGYLGVNTSDVNTATARQLGVSTQTGVLVDSVEAGGAAMCAGIQPKDLIIKIDNHVIENASALREVIARYAPGNKLRVTVIRSKVQQVIAVVLLPNQKKAPAVLTNIELLRLLGIRVEDLSTNEKILLQVNGGIKVTAIAAERNRRYSNLEEGFIITRVNSKAVMTAGEFFNELRKSDGRVRLEGFYPGFPGVYEFTFEL